MTHPEKVDPDHQDPNADEEIVEMGLLLCPWQLAALEGLARQRGLTAGQMVRRLIRDFLRSAGPPAG